MPEMDGFQALKQLQSLEETSNIPIITVSTNAIEKAKQAGFTNYITKLIEIQSFISIISKILGKQINKIE